MLIVDSRNYFVVDSRIRIALLLFYFVDALFIQKKLHPFGESVDVPVSFHCGIEA